jgi:hypothetical protein
MIKTAVAFACLTAIGTWGAFAQSPTPDESHNLPSHGRPKTGSERECVKRSELMTFTAPGQRRTYILRCMGRS